MRGNTCLFVRFLLLRFCPRGKFFLGQFFIRGKSIQRTNDSAVDRTSIRALYSKEISLIYESDFNESTCGVYWATCDVIFLSMNNVLGRMKSRPENSILLQIFNTIFSRDRVER